MAYRVELTDSAQADLDEIYRHIAQTDSRASADYVLDRLLEAAESLTAFPERGSQPRELEQAGSPRFRQLFFKPYRLIYRVVDDRVIIYLIADGRRDMPALLARRLLGQ
jgi:toxin ParE1/3/4